MKIKTTDLPEPIGYCSVSNAQKNAKGVPEGKKITDRSFPAGAPLETSGSYFSLQPPDADSLTGKNWFGVAFLSGLLLNRPILHKRDLFISSRYCLSSF